MTGTPEAGWYSDPGDPKQLRYWDGNAWTDRILASESTPGTGTPRRGLPMIGIIGIVAAGLLAVGGITAILLNSGDDPDPSPVAVSGSPTPNPDVTTTETTDRTAPEVIVPEGWELFVSRSGSIEYAVDPAWTDIWSPELEQVVIDSSGLDAIDGELAGAWVTDGSAFSGDTVLMVFMTNVGTPMFGSLEILTEAFVEGTTISSDNAPYDIVLSQSATTTQGYDAWRLDYTMTVAGEQQYASVVVFSFKETVGFAYVLSVKQFDEWIPGFLTVVDSLVLVKPPVSP